ncbi:addiction module antitoxin [Caballeronia temeraria]|uniref:Antitoxin n=1 Tax=Caballeronia temeraria TaxID=1777137 RepID=A0A157Z6E9_9BURK|nr:type II toxin-antitoxin system prevent-host-death family antitoxin [Caballeronia temeraria]SAK41121.1 addiction module antitoxin [Caballeronia temeraria]
MAYTAKDIIPLSQARANLSELMDEVRAGNEKIITKNGESYVALISTEKLEAFYRMERARIHTVLLNDALTALKSLDENDTEDADEYVARLKARLGTQRTDHGEPDSE